MARIRTVRPEYFTSLTVASLSIEARLTFIGLWTHADDHGRCIADARLVKAALWPLDDRTVGDVERDVKEIAAVGLIRRYEANGRSYFHISGWVEHQRISHPTKSRFPAPPNGSAMARGHESPSKYVSEGIA